MRCVQKCCMLGNSFTADHTNAPNTHSQLQLIHLWPLKWMLVCTLA
jgi:hypothetical protein